MRFSTQDANELIIVRDILRNSVILGMITLPKIAKFVKHHTLKLKLNAIRRSPYKNANRIW
jgi:hypothetical protein